MSDDYENDLLVQAERAGLAKEAGNVMSLIVGVLTGEKVYPPLGTETDALVIENVKIFGNFPASPQVPIAFIWGLDSVYDFHKYLQIPQGTVFLDGSGSTGGSNAPILGVTMTFNKAYFIQSIPAQDVKFSPQLGDSYVNGYAASGKISLVSDATSSTSVALSGTYSWGHIQDVGSMMDLSEPELEQQSISPKDGAMNVPVQEGWMGLVAMDSRFECRPIYNSDNNGSASALTKWTTDITNGQVYATSEGTTAAPTNPILPSNGLWISQLTTATWISSGSTSSSYTGPTISPFDAPVISLTIVPPIAASSADAGSATALRGYVDVWFYFGNANLDNSNLSQCNVAAIQPWQFPVFAQSPVDGTQVPMPRQTFLAQAKIPAGAQYIGAFIQLRRCNQTGVSTPQDFQLVQVDVGVTRYYQQNRNRVKVIRADSVTGGQNHRLNGSINVVLSPKTVVGSYVRLDRNSMKDMPWSVDTLPFLRWLFDDQNVPVRRCWKMPEYFQFEKQLRENRRLGDFIEYITSFGTQIPAEAASFLNKLRGVPRGVADIMPRLNKRIREEAEAASFRVPISHNLVEVMRDEGRVGQAGGFAEARAGDFAEDHGEAGFFGDLVHDVDKGLNMANRIIDTGNRGVDLYTRVRSGGRAAGYEDDECDEDDDEVDEEEGEAASFDPATGRLVGGGGIGVGFPAGVIVNAKTMLRNSKKYALLANPEGAAEIMGAIDWRQRQPGRAGYTTFRYNLKNPSTVAVYSVILPGNHLRNTENVASQWIRAFSNNSDWSPVISTGASNGEYPLFVTASERFRGKLTKMIDDPAYRKAALERQGKREVLRAIKTLNQPGAMQAHERNMNRAVQRFATQRIADVAEFGLPQYTTLRRGEMDRLQRPSGYEDYIPSGLRRGRGRGAAPRAAPRRTAGTSQSATQQAQSAESPSQPVPQNVANVLGSMNPR